MRCTERRSGDEGRQRHQHAGVAAAGGVQRSRGAAAAELHSEPKHERPRQHAHAYGAHLAMHGNAEQCALRQGREEESRRQRKHDHLRAEAGSSSRDDENAPGRGEPEQRMIQRQAKRASEKKQQSLLPGDRARQGDCARQKRHRRNSDDREIGPVPVIIRSKQPCIDGQISHALVRGKRILVTTGANRSGLSPFQSSHSGTEPAVYRRAGDSGSEQVPHLCRGVFGRRAMVGGSVGDVHWQLLSTKQRSPAFSNSTCHLVCCGILYLFRANQRLVDPSPAHHGAYR